jgi:hypothetical protein
VSFTSEATSQFKISIKRNANRALNQKRSEIFSAKSNCGTASQNLKLRAKAHIFGFKKVKKPYGRRWHRQSKGFYFTCLPKRDINVYLMWLSIYSAL